MIARLSLTAALLATSAPLAAQTVPIVLPGAPGSTPRVIDATEAIALSDTRFSPADVAFMQGMIVHHQQAVEMAQLVEDRTNNDAILKTSDRIEAGQKDEMDFMRTWLKDRNLEVAMQGTTVGAIDIGKNRDRGFDFIRGKNNLLLIRHRLNLFYSAQLALVCRQVTQTLGTGLIHITGKQIVAGDIAIEYLAGIELDFEHIRQGCCRNIHYLQLILGRDFEGFNQLFSQHLVSGILRLGDCGDQCNQDQCGCQQ